MLFGDGELISCFLRNYLSSSHLSLLLKSLWNSWWPLSGGSIWFRALRSETCRLDPSGYLNILIVTRMYCMSTEDTCTPAGQSVTSRLEAVDSGVSTVHSPWHSFLVTTFLTAPVLPSQSLRISIEVGIGRDQMGTAGAHQRWCHTCAELPKPASTKQNLLGEYPCLLHGTAMSAVQRSVCVTQSNGR